MPKQALKKKTGELRPLYKFEDNYGNYMAHTTAESKAKDGEGYRERENRITCEVTKEQDPFCCGVFSIGEWYIDSDEDVTHEAKVRLVTFMLREILKKNEYLQATTIDDKHHDPDQDYPVVENALKRAGFKNTACVKSNHGAYPIRVWHYFGKPYQALLK